MKKVRRVFVFWIIILIILAGGTVFIVYGKLLLKEERGKALPIAEELAFPESPKKPEPPVLRVEGIDVKKVLPEMPQPIEESVSKVLGTPQVIELPTEETEMPPEEDKVVPEAPKTEEEQNLR